MRRTCLFALVILSTFGQVRAGNEALMRFAGNIHQFNKLFPQEKVYLQFDNTAYFQGDDIWFKAFVVNSSDLSRTKSGVLYVDLLSPNGVLLQQQKLKIVAGQADGRIQLVDYSTEQARTLRGVRPYPSGYYEVRAYTQYMLNFDPGIIFSRVLPVYCEPEQEGDYAHPVMLPDSTYPDKLRPRQERLHDVNVSFYPEGGNMVRGLQGRVAFKATDMDGMGISGKLTLETDDGRKVVAESGHEGMGMFDFTPDSKRNRAVFEHEGRRSRVSLPQAKDEGYVMTADMDARRENLELTVSRTQSRRDSTIGVTVTCRGELVMFDELPMSGNEGGYSFDTRNWPAGVCRIVLFTANGEVLAARSVYNGNVKYVPPVIEMKADKRRYDAFGKMHLSFRLKDKDGKPFRDRFCISVRDAGDYGTQYADNLLTDFLLTSDLKGFIHNPSYYFESADKQHLRNLDLLCMVQGWERYDWEYMTDNKTFVETRRLEKGLSLNGMIMTDHVILDHAKGNVKVNVVISPIKHESVEYRHVLTGKDGYFGFDVNDFYGESEVSIRVTKANNNLKQPLTKILLERVKLPSVRRYLSEELQPLHPVVKATVKTDTVVMDVANYPAIINEQEGIVLPAVRIKGDRKYVDYFTFRSFNVEKDVDDALDKGIHSTDLGGYLIDKGYSVHYPIDYGDENKYYYDDSFTINGHDVLCYVHRGNGFQVPGHDFRPWITDTQDIESILVFDGLYSIEDIGDFAPEYMAHLKKYSPLAMDGILSKRLVILDLKLKDKKRMITGTRDAFNLAQRFTTLQGFSPSHEFYAPEYPNGAVKGDVDYRRTLYWNPNVIADENGRAEIEFYNNSYSTHFNISGAGITASGMPYILDKNF